MTKSRTLKNKLKFSLCVIIMILQFSGCDQFGSIPKDDDYLRMKKSSNYNIPEKCCAGVQINLMPLIILVSHQSISVILEFSTPHFFK